ncbi:MAG: SDR family oxidoreductase [Myxococcota bacterium]|nr:SDR family oxidoreductase [Myxococcota bacterium]
MKLKPVRDQVVVIMGASSGIGREVALRFGAAGAKVVVSARSQEGLLSLVSEIERRGGRATSIVCDVADPTQVEAVAEAAVLSFGRIDTWVHVAAVTVYARFEDTTHEEFRRVIEVNYLGQVHGFLAALPRLRTTGGGALISVSSVESSVSLPMTSAYAASKHAVEGALDALRRELIAEGVPISVTSVKPGTINTPLFDNARTRLDAKPQGPPPVYHPAVVADCVLYAAHHPVRDLYAGGAARMMMIGQAVAPGLLDRLLSRFGIEAQRSNRPPTDGGRGNLDAPRTEDNRVEGDDRKRARRFSVYTWMELHPFARLLAAGGAIAGAALLISRARSKRSLLLR